MGSASPTTIAWNQMPKAKRRAAASASPRHASRCALRVIATATATVAAIGGAIHQG